MDSKNEKEGVGNDEKPDQHLRYGWFGFTPDCLQWANSGLFFCILMSIANVFCVGTTLGLAGVIQSSIERRFQFTAQQLSYIIISYELFSLPVYIFITWLGTIGCHRPRWVAGCLFAFAIGCFIYSLPHFITEQYEPGGVGSGDENYLCSNRTGVDPCDDEDAGGESYDIVIFLLILARCFLSYGQIGLHTLGITFLDDTVPKARFSLYAAFTVIGGVLGPALGFVAGGMFLLIYTEWPSISREESGIEPGDPRWVGAWWLPLMVFGCGALLLVIPFSGFSYDLAGAAEMREEKVSEAYKVEKDEIPKNVRKIDFTRKDIWPYTKTVLTNYTFIFITLYACCDTSILNGLAIFGVKYIETQFSLTAAKAGATLGLIIIPAAIIGTLIAGNLINKLKLSIKGIMKMEAIVAGMVCFACGMFIVTCDQADFAGINVGYGNSSDLNITNTCNVDCDCDHLPFSPVCSHENIQYFSPCHAGCTDAFEDDDGKINFSNCSCISPISAQSEADWTICSSPGCNSFWAFCVFTFLGSIGMFLAVTASISATLRVLPNKQRVFGLFVSGVVVKLLGSAPGPLIMAACFDASCSLWEDTCDGQGSCFYYDNNELANLILIVGVSLKVASVVFMFLAYVLYKPPKSVISDKDVNVQEKEMEISAIPAEGNGMIPVMGNGHIPEENTGDGIQYGIEVTWL